MSGHVEREFKLLIPSAEAEAALRERLGGPVAPAVLQVNHFFDTPTRALRRAHVALRLREEQGAHVLALKGPLAERHATLAARPEEELALAAPLARELLAEERSPLDVFRASALATNPLVRHALELAGREPLALLGTFENERTRIGPLTFPRGSRGPALVFELDRTRFPAGRLDRELEVELPDGADAEQVEQGLRALFAELDLPFEAPPSKAARFFGLLEGHRS